MSVKELRLLFQTLDEKVTKEEEANWYIELEYGRETFVPTGETIQFVENSKTGEKCVIIQLTRDI